MPRTLQSMSRSAEDVAKHAQDVANHALGTHNEELVVHYSFASELIRQKVGGDSFDVRLLRRCKACRGQPRTLPNMPRTLQSMTRTLQSMPRLAEDVAKHTQDVVKHALGTNSSVCHLGLCHQGTDGKDQNGWRFSKQGLKAVKIKSIDQSENRLKIQRRKCGFRQLYFIIINYTSNYTLHLKLSEARLSL